MSAPTVSLPPPVRGLARFDLAVVRRRDVRRAALGPAGGPHGRPRDPRYPGGRSARTWLATVLDIALHAALAVVLVRAAGSVAVVAANPVPAGVLAFALVSFAHRVFVQRLFSATLGKLLTGLCLIREDTGGRPRVGPLALRWLLCGLAVVAGVLGN